MEITKNDLEMFRSAFKSDAMEIAKKSIRLEKRDNVGVIVLDQFEESANKLSTPNMMTLFEIFNEVQQDKEIKALVIISKKPKIFIAGADINEILRFTTGEATVDVLIKLQAVFSYLENLSIPTIAAIHGACMGGGTELSLACDYRIMTDSQESKIGLPEVMLGVIPGWGGTQRMPRLVGLESGLDMVLSGKAIDAKKAKKIGLVDKVVPVEFLEEKAMAWAKELAASGTKRRHYHSDLKEKLLTTIPGGKWLVFETARKKLLEKTKGHYPAPLAALNVIKETFGGDINKGLKKEAAAFAEMVKTPQAKSLISVFFLQDKNKKDKGVDVKVAPREFKRGGVLGAGTMGGGIAQLLAEKGTHVRLKDIHWPAIAKGIETASKIFKKKVERRRMKSFEFQNAMERIEGNTSYGGFKNTDIVIEAVVEDLEIKKKVFRELESKVSETTILASNTSSLSITSIASATKSPQRVVGMHFFNPVDKMPLVEVIRGKETSNETVAHTVALSRKLGKTVIVVKDSPGFVVNRILNPYLVETAHLLVEGVRPSRIDRVMETFGMAMGPCRVIDEVGIDVLLKVNQVIYGAYGNRAKAPDIYDSLVGERVLGKKTGKGIYIYNGKDVVDNLGQLTKLGVKESGSPPTDEMIVKRLVYPMIDEGARILEDGIVRAVSDIDIGMIFGTGFPPFRGGLLRYADDIGADSVVSELELLSNSLGPRFKPSNYLQQLAVKGGKFYER